MASQKDHEHGLSRFIEQRHRVRFRDALDNDRLREKLRHQLAHFDWLDDRYADWVPSADADADAVELQRRGRGALDECFAVSEDADLDGVELTLDAALNQILGSTFGALVSCVPGQLAIYAGEAPNRQIAILQRSDGLGRREGALTRASSTSVTTLVTSTSKRSSSPRTAAVSASSTASFTSADVSTYSTPVSSATLAALVLESTRAGVTHRAWRNTDRAQHLTMIAGRSDGPTLCDQAAQASRQVIDVRRVAAHEPTVPLETPSAQRLARFARSPGGVEPRRRTQLPPVRSGSQGETKR